MSNVTAVDVTGMSQADIDRLETQPSRMFIDDNGIARPSHVATTQPLSITRIHATPKAQARPLPSIKVKDTKKNRELMDKYGDRIFDQRGKMNYKALPTDVLLGKLVRRKGDSRKNLLEVLDKPFCRKLLDKIPKSELKYKSKNELKKDIRKFVGLAAEKTTRQKKKEKEERKDKKHKDTKKVEADGPENKE